MFQRWWCQCREGLHALPQIMFDRFSKSAVAFQIGDNVSQRLGHFLWEGMKPFPALGTLRRCEKTEHTVADKN